MKLRLPLGYYAQETNRDHLMDNHLGLRRLLLRLCLQLRLHRCELRSQLGVPLCNLILDQALQQATITSLSHDRSNANM